MHLSATVAHNDPHPVVTMGITAGRMVIALETNTPVKHAKTRPPATKTVPPVTTP